MNSIAKICISLLIASANAQTVEVPCERHLHPFTLHLFPFLREHMEQVAPWRLVTTEIRLVKI